MKRVRKSILNKMIFGVCGGIGEYFGIDPLLVRIIWFFTIFFKGIGIIVYLVCTIVIPTYNMSDLDD